MKSEKRKRFEKVAEKRVDKVLDGLRLLSNCSNKNNYEYSQEDIDYIFHEIRKASKDAYAKFESALSHSGPKKFKLKQIKQQ